MLQRVKSDVDNETYPDPCIICDEMISVTDRVKVIVAVLHFVDETDTEVRTEEQLTVAHYRCTRWHPTRVGKLLLHAVGGALTGVVIGLLLGLAINTVNALTK